jgi:hypothetical protein
VGSTTDIINTMFNRLSILLLVINATVPTSCKDINDYFGTAPAKVATTLHTDLEQQQQLWISTNAIQPQVNIIGKRKRTRHRSLSNLNGVSVCQKINDTKYTNLRVASFKVDSLVSQMEYKLGSCTVDCMLLCYRYDSYKVQKDDCICSGILADYKRAGSTNILRERLGEKIQKIIDGENYDNRFSTPRAQPVSSPASSPNGNMMGGNGGGENMNMNGGGNLNMNGGNGGGNQNMNGGNGGGNNNMNGGGNQNMNGGGNQNMNGGNGSGNNNMNGGNGGGNNKMNGGNGGGNNNMNGGGNGGGNMNINGGGGFKMNGGNTNMNGGGGGNDGMMKPRTPTTARPVSKAPSKEKKYFPDGPNAKNYNSDKPSVIEQVILGNSDKPSTMEQVLLGNRDKTTVQPPSPALADGAGSPASKPTMDMVDIIFQPVNG